MQNTCTLEAQLNLFQFYANSQMKFTQPPFLSTPLPLDSKPQILQKYKQSKKQECMHDKLNINNPAFKK